MHLKQRKLLYSVVGAIIALLFAIITLVTMMPLSAFAASKAIDDASVENNSSMSTDVIYQIVTDRFVDGDSSNNPSGEIYDKNNLKKYHGGDWVGVDIPALPSRAQKMRFREAEKSLPAALLVLPSPPSPPILPKSAAHPAVRNRCPPPSHKSGRWIPPAAHPHCPYVPADSP